MKRLHLFIMVMTAMVMASGCNRDDDHGTVTPPDTGETSITLTLKVPGVTAPVSRALSDADENKIDVLDVLVFEIDGSSETFLYATHGSSAGTDQWRVPLQVGTGKPHRLVLLANLADAVEAAYQADEFVKGRDKDDLLSTIIFDASGVWDTTTPDYLPMWGESGQVLVTHNQVSDVDPIRMLRSVARVDLVMNPDISGAGQGFNYFTLDEVKIYNASEKGFAVPDPANVTGYLATDPTVDASIARTARSYPMDATQKKNGLVRNIYIAESDNNISGMDYKDQTCLIISGKYRDDLAPTWYRIDFKSFTPPPPENWDILRNHRYTVGVTSIDGRGYDTEDEALRSKAINIETEIEIWDENDVPITDTDGQYFLKVNTDSLYFYKEGRERLLSIHTDHPDGWSLEIESPGMDWVTASLMSANTGTKDETFIECTDYTPVNSVETHREGYITIKAGRIRRNIKIYQVAEPELTIEVSPNELVFRKSGSSPKSVTVKVYPETTKVYFSEATIPNTNPISWVSGSGFPLSGYTWVSPGVYSFQPVANPSSTDLLSSLINVYIMDDDGRIVGQTVTISQWATDLLFDYTPKTPFPAAGGSATVYVDSDTDWWVYGKEDADGVIATWHDTRYEPGTGTPYTFSISPNNTWSARSGKLGVKSTDNDFAGDYIIVNQAAPVTSLVTSPANGQTIAFGNAASPGTQNVTVTSNATWTLSKGSNFADVASVTVTSGGSHTYSGTPGSNVVQFTPSSWGAATTTPAAGTLKTTTATFTTTNHSPAGASSSQVTLTRAVPAIFALTSTAATLTTWVETTYDVKASTNAYWKATPSEMGKIGTGAAGAWATNKTATITIPKNNTWTTGTVAVNRDITVTTEYGLTTSYGSKGSSFIIKQPGLYISAASSNVGTSIVTAGKNVIVYVKGSYEANTVKARSVIISGNTVTDMGNEKNITTAQNKSTGNTTITIPANNTWASRSVRIQYYHPGTKKWETATTEVTQALRYSLRYSSTTLPSQIPGEGGTYSFTFTGETDTNFQVRAVVNGSQVGISTASKGLTHSVKVPSADAQRTVVFEYYDPGSKSWKDLKLNRTQLIGPYDLGSFYLEREDRGPGNWNTANGSCPSGWRLPTFVERNALNGRTDLGFVQARNYWSGASAGSTTYYIYSNNPAGQTSQQGYVTTIYWRCVKSK